MEVNEKMSSREMYNLIIKLESEGMTAEKIIEIIKFIEENWLSKEHLRNEYLKSEQLNIKKV